MQTKLYATRDKNCLNISVEHYEMLQFLGIIVLSGYHTLPEETHYWCNQVDLGVPTVSEAISSKCFSQIKRYFHIADNAQLVQGQKAAKVLPLYGDVYSPI